MHGNPAEFIESISGGLGFYYLLIAAMNWLAALYLWRQGDHGEGDHPGAAPCCSFLGIPVTLPIVWLGLGGLFLLLAPLAMIGMPLPVGWYWIGDHWGAVRAFVDAVSGPEFITIGALVALTVLFMARRFFVKPVVAWSLFNLSLLVMGVSMTDPNFAAIVSKPDNVPIVGLVFLLGFFTWLAASRAVANDERARQGLEPLEKLGNEKILVWPDLVYTELICMVALTALLFVWGIALQAPLEEPASSVKTPNPSKAPWYFLGLQEMLVYYDPWMAGVVLPSVVIVGLMAIPFIDFNKQGNGYYTIEQRKFSYIMFQIGFLELWVVLIVMGTFLRGPNWNFFGPFEYWDPHKVDAQTNLQFSEILWLHILQMSPPKPPPDSGTLTVLGYALFREAPGIIAVLAYFIVMPPVMAVTIFRKFFVRMGFIRYMVLANLLLLMMALPIKMVLRWTINLKYFINIPEFFLNF